MLSVSRRDASWKPDSLADDVVRADAKVRKAEPAVLIRDGRGGDVGLDLRRGDVDARDDGAGRVDDAAADAGDVDGLLRARGAGYTPARTQAQDTREKET